MLGVQKYPMGIPIGNSNYVTNHMKIHEYSLGYPQPGIPVRNIVKDAFLTRKRLRTPILSPELITLRNVRRFTTQVTMLQIVEVVK